MAKSFRDKFKKKGIALKGEERKKSIFKRKIGKKKKVYTDAHCAYVDENGKRCTRKAIGSGQTCIQHGGSKDITNTLSPEATGMFLATIGTVTKFLPALHPLQYIDLSRQGASAVEIAAEMGVGVETLKGWAETHQEMALAVEVGKAMHEAWWLSKGKKGLTDRGFNTPLFKFLTSNKLGYSDKMETKSTNMHIHGVLVVPAKQTESEWEDSGMKKAGNNEGNNDGNNDDVVDI